MKTKQRLLLVEDDERLAASLTRVLRSEGFAVDHATAGDQGLQLACERTYGVVLTDLRLPGLGGMELVERLHASRSLLPVILITAHGTAETAIKATERGAFDYLLKPFAMPELLTMIGRALAQPRSRLGLVDPRSSVEERDSIVGRSRAMQEVYKEIGRVAAQKVTVLICGETGTGKEVIARAIWRHSGRGDKPFIAVNCAAIPDSLLESELFGHEKGAFTGAHTQRVGRFEQANGGTIFLDEIGDVSAATQVRLLRVLQEGCIQRVGGDDIVPVDVRILVATHRNLEDAMAREQFREDLYYRISVVRIGVPPLRERLDDVPILANHFARSYSEKFGMVFGGFQSPAIERLQQHPWRGNVRELENVVRRLLLAARGFPVTAELVRSALAVSLTGSGGSESPTLAALVDTLLRKAARSDRGDVHAAAIEAVEVELLRQAMILAHGNQSRVARWLGLSRLTLRDKLHRRGLHPADERGCAAGAGESSA